MRDVPSHHKRIHFRLTTGPQSSFISSLLDTLGFTSVKLVGTLDLFSKLSWVYDIQLFGKLNISYRAQGQGDRHCLLLRYFFGSLLLKYCSSCFSSQ